MAEERVLLLSAVVLTAASVGVALLPAASVGSAPVTTDGGAPNQAFDSTGSSAVDAPPAGEYHRQSGPHTVRIVLPSGTGSRVVDICLASEPDAGPRHQLACRTRALDGPTARTLTYRIERWPDEAVGPQALHLLVRDPSSGAVIARDSVEYRVPSGDADVDGDGLPGRREAEIGTNSTRADSDDDRSPDVREVASVGTGPLVEGADGDGLTDGAGVNVHRTEPAKADTDGDGLTDALEVAEYDTNRADTDGDGLRDGEEAYVHATDPRKSDTDGDGLTDGAEVRSLGTDPTVADTEDAGLAVGAGAMDAGTDPARPDTDGDEVAGEGDAATGTKPADSAPRPAGRGAAVEEGVCLPTRGTGAVLFGLFGIGAVVIGIGRLVDRSAVSSIRSPFVRALGRSSGTGTASTATPAVAASRRFLPDDERVLRLLDDHDGRMNQGDIVEATEWSKAKVSRVLSAMAEEGQVRKIRVGRRNLIARPGDEPAVADPPFG